MPINNRTDFLTPCQNQLENVLSCYLQVLQLAAKCDYFLRTFNIHINSSSQIIIKFNPGSRMEHNVHIATKQLQIGI